MKRGRLLWAIPLATIAVAVLYGQPVPDDPPPPEIHCKHFIHGYPLGAPATNDLIVRDVYALSSNDETKFADWVCYYLTPHETMGTLDLERKWRTDPWLDAKETLEASPDDYAGAHTNFDYDRGHLAPLASFKGSKYASQVNIYSNITPQLGPMNQGPWKDLEGLVRDMVDYYQAVWVMTGTLYEHDVDQLPQANETHRVPSGFWKIIVVDDDGVHRAAAFVMDQGAARNSALTDHQESIDTVEQRSGLRFFWDDAPPDVVASKAEDAPDWMEDWVE